MLKQTVSEFSITPIVRARLAVKLNYALSGEPRIARTSLSLRCQLKKQLRIVADGATKVAFRDMLMI